MKTLVFGILVILFAILPTEAGQTKKHYSFKPDECLVTGGGEAAPGISSFAGEKASLNCEVLGNRLHCKISTDAQGSQLYSITFAPDGTRFIAKAEQGNVFIVGNIQSKDVYWASSNVAAPWLGVITKSCKGKIL